MCARVFCLWVFISKAHRGLNRDNNSNFIRQASWSDYRDKKETLKVKLTLVGLFSIKKITQTRALQSSNEFCIQATFNHFSRRCSNRCAILPRTNVFFYFFHSNQKANKGFERRIHLTMKRRLKIDQLRSRGGNMCLALLKAVNYWVFSEEWVLKIDLEFFLQEKVCKFFMILFAF